MVQTDSTPPVGRVVVGTLAAAIVPGAGHLVAGKTRLGLVLLAAMAAGVTVAVLHLTRGVGLLESHLGGFLFPVLLRALIVLHAFSVLDAYVWGVDPRATRSFPARRQAVLLNLLVPGSGYLFARAWLRMGTGLALLVLVLVFARAGRHPYLDVIYVGMQAIMAIAVYHQMSMRLQAELDHKGRDAPRPLPRVGGGQVVAMLVCVAAAGAFCYVVYQALPGTTSLTVKDIDPPRRTSSGVELRVPRLGFSMIAGSDWEVTSNPGEGYLFEARKGGAHLMVGVQEIPSFVRRERILDRVRKRMESQGLTHQRSLDLKLGGRPAVEMRFAGRDEGGPVDHWTVVVLSPSQKLAYLVRFYCRRSVCEKLQSELERTRDSFRLK